MTRPSDNHDHQFKIPPLNSRPIHKIHNSSNTKQHLRLTINNNNNLKGKKEQSIILEVPQIRTDLEPVSRIPKHMISTKDSGDDGRNSSPVLGKPISPYNPGNWLGDLTRRLFLGNDGDLREIRQCDRVHWWLLRVEMRCDQSVHLRATYQPGESYRRRSKLLRILFHR